jgi:hypothetical protein
MKTQKIIAAIESSKELSKAIKSSSYYSNEQFISDAKRYIQAINKGTMINSIGSVSNSGMSRTIKFLAPEYNKYTKRYQYCNFFAFFKALGFNEARSKEHYFSIGGCGMDMIFHTNYTIIHRLHRLGFITKKPCDFLAQQTPQTI